jgi:hypothetical protein
LPLIADNIVVYLVRVLIRVFLRARSRSWVKTESTINRTVASERTMYPYAEICYAYKVAFERYSGKYKRGFWYRDSAQNFAQKFVPSEHLTVRVHPTNPQKSYVFEEDQSWWKGWGWN